MEAKPKHNPPHGMESYDLGGPGDLGALSSEQQEKLNEFKIKTRTENELYLRKHPEVDCLIAGFMNDILTKRPNDVREFAAGYFTHPELSSKVKQQLEDRIQAQRLNKATVLQYCRLFYQRIQEKKVLSESVDSLVENDLVMDIIHAILDTVCDAVDI